MPTERPACPMETLPQRRHSVDIRLKEHQRHIRLEHPDKSAVPEHSIGQGHCIQLSRAVAGSYSTLSYFPSCSLSPPFQPIRGIRWPPPSFLAPFPPLLSARPRPSLCRGTRTGTHSSLGNHQVQTIFQIGSRLGLSSKFCFDISTLGWDADGRRHRLHKPWKVLYCIVQLRPLAQEGESHYSLDFGRRVAAGAWERYIPVWSLIASVLGNCIFPYLFFYVFAYVFKLY
jgi:hypothetical protein